MTASLTLERATARYDAHKEIGPITLDLNSGEVLGLIGANGAGKSTVMKMATGLIDLTAGEIRICGVPVSKGRLPADCAALLERPAFLDRLSALENMLAACAGRQERRARVEETLDLVGLAAGDSRAVGHYSMGMRQRLAIARVLLSRPRVLFLDEPTNGLDPEGFRWIRELVSALAAEGTSIVISSHFLGELETMVSRALVLKAGAVVANDVLGNLISRYATLETLYFATADAPGHG